MSTPDNKRNSHQTLLNQNIGHMKNLPRFDLANYVTLTTLGKHWATFLLKTPEDRHND